VYCLFGGRGPRRYSAYVGLADSLRRRVLHHLVLRNSSVTTGAAAVSLNPALVTEIDWWTSEDFSDRVTLEAAELVAFEVLEPALRSRGAVTAAAKSLADSSKFALTMSALFRGPPAGHMTFADTEQVHERLDDLERRVQLLESRLGAGKKP
jgi:hypothetical protein